MNRIVAAVGFVFVAFFLTGLVWVGVVNDGGGKKLSLEKVASHQLGMKETATIEISGQGFDSKTRVFMHMDVNNHSAEIVTIPLDGVLYDLELVDDILFVAGHSSGISRIDVSVPSAPRLIVSPLFTDYKVFDIERVGDLLCFSCGDQGLKIARIGAGGKIQDLTSVPIWGHALASKAIGNYLYVSGGNNALTVYDLNDLASRPVGSFKSSTAIKGLDKYGNYLCLRTKKGVIILDTTYPESPVQVGQIATEDAPRAISIIDKTLYVMENGRVSQYDLADPRNPVPVVKQTYFNSPHRLCRIDDRLYLPLGHSGLGILDVSKGMLPPAADFIDLGGDSRAGVQIGGLLYAAVSDIGIKVLNPAAILSREVTEHIAIPGEVNEFALVGDHIFITSKRSSLYHKALPDRLSNYDTSTTTVSFLDDLAVINQWLFAAGKTRGLAVFDVSSATGPRLVAEFPDFIASAIAVDGDYLLTVDGTALMLVQWAGEEGLKILDRVDSSATVRVWASNGLVFAAAEVGAVDIYRRERNKLVFLSRLQLPFPLSRFAEPLSLQVVDRTLYLANGRSGLMVADIQDPLQPVVIGALDLPGYANGLLVEEERCYVSSRYSGLHTVDISDRSKPKLLDTITIHDLAGGIKKHGGLLYLGNRYLGISAIPEPVEVTDVEVLSDRQLQVVVPPPQRPGRYSLRVGNRHGSVQLPGILNYR